MLPCASRVGQTEAGVTMEAAQSGSRTHFAHFGHWLGVGGVAAYDNARAHHWQARLHWLMTGVALLALPALYLENFAAWALDLFIFIAFSLELVWMLHVTSHKAHYLARNWLSLLIVLVSGANLFGLGAGWVPLARLLRVALVGLLLLRSLGSLRKLFTPSGLPYVMLFSLVSLLLAGAGFYWLEPTVHSYADGLWLAFVTGSTLGYGDFIPSTGVSRLFAVLMVMAGLTLLSIFTASIAAFFVGEDEKILRRELHRDIKALREEVAQLREELRQYRQEEQRDARD
ncbi:MAG: ion channel [Pseudomonadota bacterium]